MKKNYKKVAHSLDFRARRGRHWELRKQWKELFSNSSLGYFALKEDEPPISEREVTRGEGQHWKIKLKSFVGAVEMRTLSRESEVAPFLGLATDPQPYTNPLSCISNSFAHKRQLRSLGLMDQGAAPSLLAFHAHCSMWRGWVHAKRLDTSDPYVQLFITYLWPLSLPLTHSSQLGPSSIPTPCATPNNSH